MATSQQEALVQDIISIAFKVQAQKKYHPFFEYSGHVNSLHVRVIYADNDYQTGSSKYVAGLNFFDCEIDFDRKKDCRDLAVIRAKLYALLDLDSDGIPV